MKKYIYQIIIAFITGLILVTSCKTNQAITAKPGVQLWSENCTRCHYAPSPTLYSDKQWDIVGTHMKVRANLTQDEINKIVDFLQTTN